MDTNASRDGQPLVSVVTPAYNQAAFLRDTIESVLSQDYPHIEYRVIDDGSTDHTLSILQSYTGRILWESHPNRGQTPTINTGWQKSSGTFITWLNSDDTFLPGAVTKGVEYLLQHPDIDIVFGDTLFTEADGTPTSRTESKGEFDYERFVFECHNTIPQPSAFIRRRVIETEGILDPHYYFFMDWDFWLRAGLHHRIAYFPELLSTYRLHPDSKSVSQSRRSAPELEYMYEKFFTRVDLPPRIRDQERRAKANMYFTSAGYYSRGGDLTTTTRMGLKALGVFPEMLLYPRMVQYLLYCLVGETRLYRLLRRFYLNTRGASASVKTYEWV